jgi:hypothetical protein
MRVNVVFERAGRWYERSLTVEQMWTLIRDPLVSHLETL